MNPVVLRPTRVAYINVLGFIWWPQVKSAYNYQLSNNDLENIGELNRENIQNWLDKNAGDFSEIYDFEAQVGDELIKWENDESEFEYKDLTGGIDDD